MQIAVSLPCWSRTEGERAEFRAQQPRTHPFACTSSIERAIKRQADSNSEHTMYPENLRLQKLRKVMHAVVHNGHLVVAERGVVLPPSSRANLQARLRRVLSGCHEQRLLPVQLLSRFRELQIE
jgi:hypothetical protein